MSQTQTTPELAAIAGQATAEVERLRQEISSIPSELVEIERRLKYALNEEAMRTLIEQRAKLQEAREIKPAMLRGAEIRRLRAESAHLSRLAEEAAPGLPEAIAAHEEAKAALEVAAQTAKVAGKRRGRIENAVGELTARAQKLASEAEALERA